MKFNNPLLDNINSLQTTNSDISCQTRSYINIQSILKDINNIYTISQDDWNIIDLDWIVKIVNNDLFNIDKFIPYIQRMSTNHQLGLCNIDISFIDYINLFNIRDAPRVSVKHSSENI